MANKSAVVVGVAPARGLGAAIARRFAREGLRLTVLGRNAEKLNATVAEMRGAGAVVDGIVGDVTDQSTVARAVAAAEAVAPLEVAVFNAGLTGCSIRMRSRKIIGACTRSSAALGRTNWTCGRGSRRGDAEALRPPRPFRFSDGRRADR